jgi:glycosyltransferase involved in cell wall biosynthesis
VTRRLNIAIATAGRFHVLDLARELHELGHQVRFYSYVPRARTRRFGLPDECHVSLLPLVLPAVAWQGLMPRLVPTIRERVFYALLNRAVMMRLHPCDVFICMSGIFLEAARFAKERYDATIWLERGSRHILSQDEILAAVPGAERPSLFAIRRELAGYALADRVVIPSHHVAESFRRDESTYDKLFYNPYGVDLSMFPLRPDRGPSELLSLLFIGTWSLQKGCDLLAEGVRKIRSVRLTHVGAIGDLAFPTGDDQFVHVDPVPQAELARFYAAADVFVLASRQDGFGVVLSQALASGLPVICTDRTGGPDLQHTSALAARISVVPAGDLDALTHAIAEWYNRLRTLESFSVLYVGSWSLRKGCDILTEAVKQVAGVRLTHVGAMGDCEFPAGHSQFIHVDPVPQPELATVYSEADLFILASREEGLSTVLIQALASGLPLVCTERTGGADLALTPALAARITVVPHDDVGALACAIAGWRDRRLGGERLPRLSETDREKLSWAAYARRYSDELSSTIGSGIHYQNGVHTHASRDAQHRA